MPYDRDTLPADVILNSKWKLTFEWNEIDRDQYVAQGFVIGPNHSSASLNFALECGTTSDEKEIEIPATIMKQLEKYAEFA